MLNTNKNTPIDLPFVETFDVPGWFLEYRSEYIVPVQFIVQ